MMTSDIATRRFTIKDASGKVLHTLTVPADAPEALIHESLQRLRDALIPKEPIDVMVNDVPCVVCPVCPLDPTPTVVAVRDFFAHTVTHAVEMQP